MTPHLHALAMRTKAGGVVYPTLLDTALSRDLEATILALPLEADHAALLGEAVKLPEIALIVKWAKEIFDASDPDDEDSDFCDQPREFAEGIAFDNRRDAVAAALKALETP